MPPFVDRSLDGYAFDHALDRYTRVQQASGRIVDRFQFSNKYAAFVNEYSDSIGWAQKFYIVASDDGVEYLDPKLVSAQAIGGVITRLMLDNDARRGAKVTSSILRPEFRQRGIMRDLYAALACYFVALYSDTVVSSSADRLWRSLERSGQVEIRDTGSRYQALCKE